MKKSKYTDEQKAYALSVVKRFGSCERAAQYLKDEGKIIVSGKTLQNWNNDTSLAPLVPEQDALVVAAEVGCLAEVSDDVILSNATKGLNAVVDRLNERLSDDRYTKRITNNELVNIGSFFASLKELDKDKQTNSSGTTNIYQQIINQHYHAKGH